MIPPFAWVGELVPFFLRWGHKSQHVCHNVHKKLLVRSLFYTCIYFELTKHLGCGFKVDTKHEQNDQLERSTEIHHHCPDGHRWRHRHDVVPVTDSHPPPSYHEHINNQQHPTEMVKTFSRPPPRNCSLRVTQRSDSDSR